MVASKSSNCVVVTGVGCRKSSQREVTPDSPRYPNLAGTTYELSVGCLVAMEMARLGKRVFAITHHADAAVLLEAIWDQAELAVEVLTGDLNDPSFVANVWSKLPRGCSRARVIYCPDNLPVEQLAAGLTLTAIEGYVLHLHGFLTSLAPLEAIPALDLTILAPAHGMHNLARMMLESIGAEGHLASGARSVAFGSLLEADGVNGKIKPPPSLLPVDEIVAALCADEREAGDTQVTVEPRMSIQWQIAGRQDVIGGEVAAPATALTPRVLSTRLDVVASGVAAMPDALTPPCWVEAISNDVLRAVSGCVKYHLQRDETIYPIPHRVNLGDIERFLSNNPSRRQLYGHLRALFDAVLWEAETTLLWGSVMRRPNEPGTLNVLAVLPDDYALGEAGSDISQGLAAATTCTTAATEVLLGSPDYVREHYGGIRFGWIRSSTMNAHRNLVRSAALFDPATHEPLGCLYRPQRTIISTAASKPWTNHRILYHPPAVPDYCSLLDVVPLLEETEGPELAPIIAERLRAFYEP